jgi:carbamoyl-phosphate synthase large subunit
MSHGIADKRKVLVTGAGALLGQGIIRALRFSSYPVHIVAVDPDPRAVGLYWADTAHLIPLVNDKEYESAIREVMDLERPDILLVGTDIELPFFSRSRLSLEADYNMSVLVSNPTVVEIADDKWMTFNFLRDNEFPHPMSTLSLEDQEFFSKVNYPLILKPRRGARSIGFTIAHSRVQLERAFHELEDPIIQEHVGTPDDEYTAGALVFEGSCMASIVMCRELRDGNTYRAVVEPYSRLNEEVRRLAERLNPYGPVNFQFRVESGEVKVFEINARFSGTTPLRARAGFNDVEMCLRHVLEGEQIVSPEIRPMVMLRHWEETVVERHIFDLVSMKSKIPEVLDA